MIWVTWESVGVDRMACAWLVLRTIDPAAEFRFIPVGSLAVPEDATPFDIPDVCLSHHNGHFSIHAFLREYQLTDPVLQRIAAIVDEADTITEVELEPVARGLDMICNGLRRISRDDHEALDRGLVVYDALYAQLSTEGRKP